MSAVDILRYWGEKVITQINCHVDSHTQIEHIENTILRLAKEGISNDIDNFKTVVLTPMAELGRKKFHEERVTTRKDTLSILKKVLEKVDNYEYRFAVLEYIKILGELYPLETEFVKKEYKIFTNPSDESKKKQIEDIIKNNKNNYKLMDLDFQYLLGVDISGQSDVKTEKTSNFYSTLGLGTGGKKKKNSNTKTKKKEKGYKK